MKKKLVAKTSWKRMLILTAVLVLTLGAALSAFPAGAEGDSIKDSLYRILKKKQQSSPAADTSAADSGWQDSGNASDSGDDDGEEPVSEAAPRAAAPEVSSPYVTVKLSGDAYATDIGAQVAAYYPEVEVLTAFHIENADPATRISVYIKKTPRLQKGDKLLLVGMNGLQMNERISVSQVAAGRTVVLSAAMMDGFALIIRHPAAKAAEPAKPEEPAEEPAAEQTEEPAEEPAAEQPEEPAEEPAAEQPEEPAEEPAAEQPEEPAGEPAAEQPEETPEEAAVREKAASASSLSADLGDGAVAVLSGSIPDGVTMRVKLLSVSVVKLINQATVKGKNVKNVYAFDLLLKNADGSSYDPEEPLTLTVSGGKVAKALSEGRTLAVSTLPGKQAVEELNAQAAGGTVSFPVRGNAAYRIDASPIPNAPAVPEPDPLNVTITSSMNGMILLGDTITLTGRVENADGALTYLWECDRGSGFEPVENADGDTLSFEATMESVLWNWRLTVTADSGVRTPAAVASR